MQTTVLRQRPSVLAVEWRRGAVPVGILWWHFGVMGRAARAFLDVSCPPGRRKEAIGLHNLR
jgi:hypothetical protein